jgi:hypothetical protein
VVAIALTLALAAMAAPATAWTRIGHLKVRSQVSSLVPPNGTLFGSWVKPRTGYTMDDQKAAVKGFEAAVGRKLDIDHHYYTFFDSFPNWHETWDLDHGRTPLISWNGVSSRRIASGAVDSTIDARARGIRDLGTPVFLRYGAEMDGSANRGWVEGPKAFIRAWRHLHDEFAAQGATNAVWVWCPNASGFTWTNAKAYYPGSRYVDWICADGYNWAPGQHGADWRSFAKIFRDWYAFGVAKDRPLMVGETGVQEGKPGEKAAWLNQARRQIRSRFPAIRAFVYFNSDSSYPWWIDSSRSALDAFRSMALDPHFRTR